MGQDSCQASEAFHGIKTVHFGVNRIAKMHDDYVITGIGSPHKAARIGMKEQDAPVTERRGGRSRQEFFCQFNHFRVRFHIIHSLYPGMLQNFREEPRHPATDEEHLPGLTMLQHGQMDSIFRSLEVGGRKQEQTVGE